MIDELFLYLLFSFAPIDPPSVRLLTEGARAHEMVIRVGFDLLRLVHKMQNNQRKFKSIFKSIIGPGAFSCFKSLNSVAHIEDSNQVSRGSFQNICLVPHKTAMPP